MDPNTCLRRILDALRDADRDEFLEAMIDLFQWVEKGGALPTDPIAVRADAIRAAIGDDLFAIERAHRDRAAEYRAMFKQSKANRETELALLARVCSLVARASTNRALGIEEPIDTSDIPEADEDWFRRAKLR